MNTYELITSRVMQSLERGVVPWKKPWGESNWPTNAYTRKKYTGCNVFLLRATDFPSTFWVGYSQAQHMGTHVKKGEKGTQIVKWNPLKRKDDEGNIVIVGMAPQILTVFNLSQTTADWESLEEKGTEPVLLRDAEDVVNGYRDRPGIEYGYQDACYNPIKDLVRMPNRDRFESSEGFYSCLFHELAHSTGHESRLNRNLKNFFGDEKYSLEELVAEMGAAFLGGECGILDQTFENTVGYIESWLKALSKDKGMFVKAASQAQRAADYILGKTKNEI